MLNRQFSLAPDWIACIMNTHTNKHTQTHTLANIINCTFGVTNTKRISPTQNAVIECDTTRCTRATNEARYVTEWWRRRTPSSIYHVPNGEFNWLLQRTEPKHTVRTGIKLKSCVCDCYLNRIHKHATHTSRRLCISITRTNVLHWLVVGELLYMWPEFNIIMNHAMGLRVITCVCVCCITSD